MLSLNSTVEVDVLLFHWFRGLFGSDLSPSFVELSWTLVFSDTAFKFYIYLR